MLVGLAAKLLAEKINRAVVAAIFDSFITSYSLFTMGVCPVQADRQRSGEVLNCKG
jgi:hypothetical protein